MIVTQRIAFDSKEEKKQLIEILCKYKSEDDKQKAAEDVKTIMGLKGNVIMIVMDRFWANRFAVSKKYQS